MVWPVRGAAGRWVAAATAATTVALAWAGPVAAESKPSKASTVSGKPTKNPQPVATMVLCNHSGYAFGVYAYGPKSLHRTDLGGFDECVRWAKLPQGSYAVGYNLRVPSQRNVVLQMRIKQDGHSVYRTLGGDGTVTVKLAARKTTRIDFFPPRG